MSSLALKREQIPTGHNKILTSSQASSTTCGSSLTLCDSNLQATPATDGQALNTRAFGQLAHLPGTPFPRPHLPSSPAHL